MLTVSETAVFNTFQKYKWLLGEIPRTRKGRRIGDNVLKSVMFLKDFKCVVKIDDNLKFDTYIPLLTTYEQFFNIINDIYVNQHGIKKIDDCNCWVKFYIYPNKNDELYIYIYYVSIFI